MPLEAEKDFFALRVADLLATLSALPLRAPSVLGEEEASDARLLERVFGEVLPLDTFFAFADRGAVGLDFEILLEVFEMVGATFLAFATLVVDEIVLLDVLLSGLNPPLAAADLPALNDAMTQSFRGNSLLSRGLRRFVLPGSSLS